MTTFTRPVWGGLVTQIFSAVSLSMFMAYLGIYLDDLLATAIIISLTFALRNALQIFIRVPLAEFSQIVGRKPMILSGMTMYTISFLFLSLATDWEFVMIATTCIAVGMSMYYPSVFAYIGDISSKSKNYGRINGILFQGSDIGMIISSFGASYLFRNAGYSIVQLFDLLFFIGIIGVIISFIVLPESLANEDRKIVSSKINALSHSFTHSFQSLIKMTKMKSLGAVYAFQLVISYTEYFIGSFFPLLIKTGKGYSNADVANILMVSTILILLLKPYLGSLSDRFGYRRPVIVALSINITVLILFTLVKTIPQLILLYCIYRSASIMSYSGLNSASSNAVPSNLRGLAMGGLGFYVSFGRTSSSLILAPIWEYMDKTYQNDVLSINTLFYVSAFIISILTVSVAIKSKMNDKRNKNM